jgi:ABC-type spermidine/putrescine transport system permease subunit I
MVTAAAVSTFSAALGYVAAYLIQTNRKKRRAFKK